MSKQSEAKAVQQYNPKPVHPMCSNCSHSRSVIERFDKWLESWEKESNMWCAIGGFAVKKTGVCNRHDFTHATDKTPNDE